MPVNRIKFLRFSVASITILFCGIIWADVIRIMPLGDSITEGLGSTGDVGYRRDLYLSLAGAGYDVNFVGSLSHGCPNDFDRDHEGHYAWHAEQIGNNICCWLQENPADIILLYIGTNDMMDYLPVSETIADINQILNNIDFYETEHNARICVIIAKIINCNLNNSGIEALNNEIQNIYNTRTAAGDNLILVDMQSAVDENDMSDIAHPNDSGYLKMANVWRPSVLAAIAEGELTADLDDNSIVNLNDLSILAGHWNSMEPNSPDLIKDGKIDEKDLGEFCNQWLFTEPWYTQDSTKD